MVDLNHIFLFLAVVSPLLVLARGWRPGGTDRGWQVAALIVLVITGASWLLFRDRAGYIGGGAWFAILFLPAVGLRKSAELFAEHRYRSARRLAMVLQVLHPTTELREQVRLLRTLESREADESFRSFVQAQTARRDRPTSPSEGSPPRRAQSAGPPTSFDLSPRHQRAISAQETARLGRVRRHRRLKNAPAVLIFILLNLVAFLFELSRRNWRDPDMLHRLGALDPYSVLVNHEYWRLFTALFLHYDAVHLLFNLFAIYVLGPALERSLGSGQFAACYLISGLGSTAGVVALTLLRFVRPAELVGASGSVMGIVGAWAGFLLQHRHAPGAKERLFNILLIVAIQTAFDLSTPQVSMAAHVCGLLTGFVLGLVMALGRGGSPSRPGD